MKPIVNTDVKMPRKMLDALTLLETFCVANQIKEVDRNFVNNFLDQYNLSGSFKQEYLY
jgi:hypothetical protein